MRQAGVLAAAGLIAIEEMPKRLHEDHANARLLAERIADLPPVELDLAAVETNIVIFKLKGNGDAPALAAKLKQRGVVASAVGPHAVRFVTHRGVDRAACEQAAEIAAEELAKLC
jgi:threonine aldolase